MNGVFVNIYLVNYGLRPNDYGPMTMAHYEQ